MSDSTPVVADGLVYVLDGSARALACVDAKTGKKLWSSPKGTADGYGSPTVADGKVYIGASKGGTMNVFAVGREMKHLGSTRGAGFASCPAAVDGTLFVNTGTLWAVEKMRPGGQP